MCKRQGDACREIPMEAIAGCEAGGGKFVSKNDARGYAIFGECVKQGKAQETEVEARWTDVKSRCHNQKF